MKQENRELAQVLLLLAVLCPSVYACETKVQKGEQLDQLLESDRQQLEELLGEIG